MQEKNFCNNFFYYIVEIVWFHSSRALHVLSICTQLGHIQQSSNEPLQQNTQPFWNITAYLVLMSLQHRHFFFLLIYIFFYLGIPKIAWYKKYIQVYLETSCTHQWTNDNLSSKCHIFILFYFFLLNLLKLLNLHQCHE